MMRGERARYDAPTDVRAVLTINIGYRSLIDWTNTPEWTHAFQGPQGRGERTPGSVMGQDVGTAGIPTTPEFWSGSLSNAPKASPGSGNVHLPGDMGAAWSVQNYRPPNMTGGHRGLAEAFGHHVPQWLYRMAEILKHGGGMSIEDLDTESMHRTDRARTEGEFIEEEHLRRPDADIVDRGMTRQQISLPSSGGTNLQPAWERLPRFANNAKNKNYARTFSESVYANLNNSVPIQFGMLKDTMMERFGSIGQTGVIQQAMGQVGQMEGGESIMGAMGRGTTGHRGEEIQATSGSTHQEAMIGVMGVGTVGTDPEVQVFGGWTTVDPEGANFGARGIDVEFYDEVVDRTPEIQGSRADLTTQAYQDSYQHGIGRTGARADVTVDGIRRLQQERITRYNQVIQILKTIYDETDLRIIRQRVGYERMPYGATGRGGWDQSRGAAPSVKDATQLRNEVIDDYIKMTGEIQDDVIMKEWDETLKFIMHASGTFLADQPWANIMPIKLTDQFGQEYLGTVVINYTQDQDGYFQDLQPGDVAVLEYSVEEWIWRLGVDNGSELSLEESLQRGNESRAVEGYQAGAVMGGLARVQSGSVGHQTAHLMMPVPGALSQAMDAYTTSILERMASGLETDLQSDVVAEAIRFSRFARQRQRMGDIPRWMEAIANAFLVPRTGGHRMDANPYVGQGGALWFLWAAPYVSTYYPKAGGGEQYRGSSQASLAP